MCKITINAYILGINTTLFGTLYQQLHFLKIMKTSVFVITNSEVGVLALSTKTKFCLWNINYYRLQIILIFNVIFLGIQPRFAIVDLVWYQKNCHSQINSGVKNRTEIFLSAFPVKQHSEVTNWIFINDSSKFVNLALIYSRQIIQSEKFIIIMFRRRSKLK
jgi:hypothetical protein